MEVVKHDILTLPERGRRITDPIILQRISFMWENGRTCLFRCVRMYEIRAVAYSKCPPSASLHLSKVGVFKLNTPINLTAWIPNHTVEVPVPTLGTAKILYKRKLDLFPMYVCTSSVRTYIANPPKRAIYAILYHDKVVGFILNPATLSA